MIVGEYDYSKNFVDNPESTWAARFLFTVFMVDMAIVLMNLVLGLAVSGTINFSKPQPGHPFANPFRSIWPFWGTKANMASLVKVRVNQAILISQES